MTQPDQEQLAALTSKVEALTRELANAQVSSNIVWTLLTGFLVMFMQCGFALVETGLTRAKNVSHTMAMNFLVYSIGILGYWMIGFGLQMGGIGPLATFGNDALLNQEFVVHVGNWDFGVFGTTGFFLSSSVYSSAVATLFLFQMVFMDTAATIPTGAMAERWRFGAFVAFSFVVAALIYPIYANWVWGGGWLAMLGRQFGLGHGHVDFAGSSVVHMVGGGCALIGAKLLGPRAGKFTPEGRPRPIPGHNMVLVVVGTFILAFGWFGFNPGSTLSGNDTRIAVIAVNTMLASAAGAFGAYVYMKTVFGQPDLSMLCNGMLAGLVAITAPCAFVGAFAAVFIGGVAGVLVIVSSLFIETRLRIDDPVGASSVHGTCGAWGVLSLGLFANGEYGEGWNSVPGPVCGLFFGDPGQFLAQCVGVVANVVWVFTLTALSMKAIDAWVGNRPSPEVEIDGLDIPEFGAPGYSWEAGTLAAQPPAVTGAQPPPRQNQHTTTVSRRIER